MAFQFVHIETYSEQPKAVKGAPDQFNSAEQVLGEAAREGHFSQHVENPQEAIQLMYAGSISLADLWEKRAALLAGIRETVTSANGKTYTRRLRADAATLYTEIHSHPMTRQEMRADPDNKYQIAHWAARIVRDFTARMPDGIDWTVVLHPDESHVHIHILAINTPDPKLDANKLHVGKCAAARWRDCNDSDVIAPLPKPELIPRPLKPRKERPSKNRQTQAKRDARHAEAVVAWEESCLPIDAENTDRISQWETANTEHIKAARQLRGKSGVQRAFNDEMKAFQDRYYEAVGKYCSLLRVGPHLARKSTKAYAADKAQAKHIAETLAESERTKEQLLEQRKGLERQQAELSQIHHQQKIRQESLQAREERLIADQTELARREDMIRKKVKVARQDVERERSEIAAAQHEKEQQLAGQAAALKKKEHELVQTAIALKNQRKEFDDAVEAMDEVLTAVESGETTVDGGKLNFQRMPAFLHGMRNIAPEQRSPIQKLVGRFINVINRVQQGIDAMRFGRGADNDSQSPGL